MKALVTGGAGFIGSNLARLLLERGNDVTILDDFSSGYRENLHELSRAEVITGDVCDVDTVGRAAEGASVIFHLAASVGNRRSIENPFLDARINLLGTISVLEAARRCGVGKVVYSSSAGIFGELQTLPIDESHPLEPDSPYGTTKLAGEKMCITYSRLYGLNALCLRYFNVFGVNQRFDEYGNVIPIFVRLMLLGQPLTIFGDGEQTRDFVNVSDVAEANFLASQTDGVSGVFNIGSATRISINKLVEMLSEVSGLQPEVRFGPRRKGDVLHSLADISAARDGFGFEPHVDLREGLREYVDWYRKTLMGPQ